MLNTELAEVSERPTRQEGRARGVAMLIASSLAILTVVDTSSHTARG